jgi:hypothetical protein
VTGAEFGGVDIDLLADYIGGVLTGTPEESAVAARIADDPAWQSAFASLTDGMAFVSAELGRFDPEPMPADVAARLDAALTVNAALTADTATAADTALTANTVTTADTPLTADTATTANTASAPNTATTANTASGPNTATTANTAPTPNAALTADARPTGSAGSTGNAELGGDTGSVAEAGPVSVADTGPSTPHLALVRGDLAVEDVANPVRKKAPAARRGRRLRWAAPIAVAAGVIAFVGFGLDYLAGRSSHSASTSSADTAAGSAENKAAAPSVGRPLASGQLLASGTDYSHATLGVAPVSPLTAPFTPNASPSIRRGSPGIAPDGGSALRRLTGPAALDDCLAAIEQANAVGAISVESVDYARFGGAPAVIVRFSAANGQWAWASGADCGTPAGVAATLDKVPVG